MSDAPRTIGRYRIEAVLGRGAMGVIYKGYDPEIDRPVAIKLVRADLLSDSSRDDYLVRFRQEARAAARCAHPNIVAVYDFALHDDNPFLTMEFVEGRNLAQAFDDGAAYQPREAITLILQVLDALAYAHERGVVHRDIKPANIIVLPSGTVKVADFGISRLPGSELTLAGSVMGTPSYMSPEQCRGEVVNHRSDLFSTGAVLYQLLTGEKPFPGGSVTEIVHKLLTTAPPELRAKGVDVPPAVSLAVRRALAKPPTDRFATAHAMAEALRQGIDAGAGAGEDGTVIATDRQVFVGFGDEPDAPTRRAPSAMPMAEPPTEATAGLTTIGRFNRETLAEIERTLARYVGPIARVLVRNAAGTAGSVAELCTGLAERITPPQERAQFLAQLRRTPVLAPGGAAAAAAIRPGAARPDHPAREPIPADALQKLQQDLAYTLGPIAKLVVQRAAPRAASLAALREELALLIDNPADRAAFLAGRSGK